MKTLLLSFGVLALILVSANASTFQSICIILLYVSEGAEKCRTLFTIIICSYSHVRMCICATVFITTGPFNPLHCRNVRCAVPDCDRGIIFTPPGQCCPRCISIRPTPWFILCLQPDCRGENRYTPDGRCCPVCRERPTDCSTVRCAAPTCLPNQKLFTPNGACCPQCCDCSSVVCDVPLCGPGSEF